MAVTAAEYDANIKALLPPGPAWPRDDTGSVMAMLIECWAVEFSRVDSQAMALINERIRGFVLRHLKIGSPNGGFLIPALRPGGRCSRMG